MKTTKIPVLVIFAPTASGKTALSLDLFGKGSLLHFKQRINAQIISADSMQVYRQMNIGTAKPSEDLLNQLPHHLIDIRNVNEQFNVGDFIIEADAACKAIWEQNCLPVIEGGTGFYIRSFLLGLPKTPESDPIIRNKLKDEAKEFGCDVLYKRLQQVDPESALKININDEYRIIRALEVYQMTGKPRSAFKVENSLRDYYDFFTIILNRDRQELYDRIDERVEIMFDQGLEDEVKSLIAKGYKSTDPGMQAIGYREFFESDDVDYIKARIKHNSHKYAKKQYIFMKGIPNAKIYNISDNTSNNELYEDILNFCSKYSCLT